jgi:hypothetical protein
MDDGRVPMSVELAGPSMRATLTFCFCSCRGNPDIEATPEYCPHAREDAYAKTNAGTRALYLQKNPARNMDGPLKKRHRTTAMKTAHHGQHFIERIGTAQIKIDQKKKRHTIFACNLKCLVKPHLQAPTLYR